ncbi:3D domain-containing protein [Chloracidobacterium thermophilum]|uniref:3D domain-containing protein n=1 Tax=Chloracidobacterium thermophilum TaxID=458033 RepID=UPI000739919A|nr:3D domain-containing protein [Chloracidobacterium thermophilum]
MSLRALGETVRRGLRLFSFKPLFTFILVLLSMVGNLAARAQQGRPTPASTQTPQPDEVSQTPSPSTSSVELTLDLPATPPLLGSFSLRNAEPSPQSVPFVATAYSLKGRTASGEYVRPGIVAADPRVLPLGSVVKVHAGQYSGVYHVKDTGGRIRGRHIDIYMPSTRDAIRFGRRTVRVEVIRTGRPQRTKLGTR